MMGEVIRVSGRAPDVGDLLREAMVSQRFADVALCCSGGQRFLAHRLVLSAASPYLQDVLLAHSKAAGFCEPITVILAEVEGPELAAILGFVYTGSATIPRARLEAFTRAAETLHVRIPPLTVPSFGHRRGVDECKLDNVKIEETKIDSRYLGCEQYPSYDKWFNSSSWPFDSCFQRSDWLVTEDERMISSRLLRRSGDPRYQRRDARVERSFVGTNDFPANDKIKLPVGEVLAAGSWISNDLPIFDGPFVDPSLPSGRSEDGNYDDLHPRVSRIPTIIHPADRESRIDTLPGNDNSVSRMIGEPVSSRHDEVAKIQPVEGTKQRDNNDFEGRLAESVPSLPLVHRTTGRSSVTFEKQDYDADVAAATGTLAGGNAPTSASATVTSNIGTNTKSVPICGESCCRWITPRRHVANRVPASPWIQLAKPAHHSPKIQPIVLRNREESVEPSRLEWNEVGSMRGKRASPFPSTVHVDQSSSMPLNLHHATATNDCPARALYGFKVPANATSPHLYDVPNYQRPQFLFPMTTIPPTTIPPTTDQFPPRISVTEVVRDSKTSSFEDPPVSSRLRSVDECPNSGSPDDAQGGISQHAISPEAKNHTVNDPLTCNLQASPRVELSHPISRLCESVSLNSDVGMQEECLKDKNINAPMRLEAIKSNTEEARSFASKFVFPLTERIVQSDNNNNEAEATVVEVSRNIAVSSAGGNEATSSSEEHRCDQCGKTFVTRASLKVHGRTHSGEKPFRCSDCGKEFSQLRNYKYHRSVHEGTREFAATCPECGKYFNDRGYLSSHMKIHRNRKEYACAECGKSFNQRVAYNMHVRIHTGVKPHQCEQCGKAFSRKMLLKQHLRTHSGERPYQCQICHKAFADRSNMTLHTRLHSGLKPYQCTLCTKAFTKKHHLKTHLNYHTGTKPYSCPNCSLRFSQSSNMRTHYKKCSAAGAENSSQHPANRGSDVNGPTIIASSSVVVAGGDRKPTAGRTNALTPPSSDQESSILTPSEEICKSNRGYPAVRSKDIGTSVHDA